MMESYYDSDDDVCWGPYTKREFLRDVLQPRNKEDIVSRHSVSCNPRFIYDIDKRGESLINLATPEPQLQSGYVTETNKCAGAEKISEILNNTREVLNCSEHYEKLEITRENKEIPNENNRKLSNKVFLDDKGKISDEILNVNSESDNLCLNSIMISDAEALTSTSANSFYKQDDDPIVNCNQTCEIQVISDSDDEALTSTSVNSFYKKNDDTVVNYNQFEEIQVISDSEESEQESESDKQNPSTINLMPAPSETKSNCDTPTRSISSQSHRRAELKISERPVRTKLGSARHSKERFKHIKSPVALYINNAPVTPLYVKVTPKKWSKVLRCENSKSCEKQTKENVIEFPRVIYRPAKRTVTNTQSTFKLPSNIESLLPVQNLVIKHVANIKGKRNSIGRRLLEEDLTLSTVSDE